MHCHAHTIRSTLPDSHRWHNLAFIPVFCTDALNRNTFEIGKKLLMRLYHSLQLPFQQFSQASKYGRVGAAKFVGGKPGCQPNLGMAYITHLPSIYMVILGMFHYWVCPHYIKWWKFRVWEVWRQKNQLDFWWFLPRMFHISDHFRSLGASRAQFCHLIWRLQGTLLDLMPRHSRFATLGSATAVPAHDYLTEVTAIELQPSVLQPNVPAVCKIWGQITFAPSPDP